MLRRRPTHARLHANRLRTAAASRLQHTQSREAGLNEGSAEGVLAVTIAVDFRTKLGPSSPGSLFSQDVKVLLARIVTLHERMAYSKLRSCARSANT